MISFNKNDMFQNEACMILSKTGEYIQVVSGKMATSSLAVAKASPKMRTIRFNDLAVFMKDKSYDGLLQLADLMRHDEIDINKCVSYSKDVQAALSNIGYNVVEVYGFKIDDKLYMYDMGFEIRCGSVSFFVDFAFCGMYEYGQFAVGFDIENSCFIFKKEEREFGHFIATCNNRFKFSPSRLTSVVTSLLPDCNDHNVSYMSNLDIIIDGIYTNLPENSFRILKTSNGDLESVISGTLLKASEFAIRIREQGAHILKTVVTSGRNKGITNIGTAKVLSADEVERLGDMMILVTSKTGMLKSEAEFIEAKFDFLEMDWPDTETQLKLGYAAGLSINELGNCTTISASLAKEISKDILDMQPSWSNNTQQHAILNEADELIGFLPCNGNAIVYDKSNTIQKSSLNYILVEDQVLSKAEIRNVAADSLNYKTLVDETERAIDYYKSKCAAFDFDYINNAILEIDERVSRTYSTLSSLLSSQSLANAAAATRYQALDLILKFPVKDAYSGFQAGTLIEYFDFRSQSDGGTEVTIRDRSHLFPFLKRVAVDRCGTTYISNNGSQPGVCDKNAMFILVGSAYAKSLNDLQGNTVSCEEISFEVAPKQTRGSGKSETEVVKLTMTEARIVCKYDEFLSQMRKILSNILNHDVVKASALIGQCVERVANACKAYGEERKPYRDQLAEYFYNSEQLFFNTHLLKMSRYRFEYADGLSINGDVSFMVSSENPFNEFETRIINSVMQGVDVKDKYIDVSSHQAAVQSIRLGIMDEINKVRTLINQSPPENGSLDTPVEFSSRIENMNELILSSDLDHTNIKFSTKAVAFNVLIGIDRLDHTTQNDQDQEKFIDGDHQQPSDLINLIKECLDNIEEMVKSYFNSMKVLSNTIEDEMSSTEIMFNGERKNIIDGKMTIENSDYVIEFDVQHSIKAYKHDDGSYVALTGNSSTSDQDIVHCTEIRATSIKLLNNHARNESAKDVIALGSMVYDTKNLLQQYIIYKNLPKMESVIQKISYNILGYHETDESKIYAAIAQIYGDQIANYFTAYCSRIDNIDSLVTILLFSAATNIRLFTSVVLANQDKKLGSLLLDKNIKLSSLASIKDLAKSLVL